MKVVENFSYFKQQIEQIALVEHLMPGVMIIHDLKGRVMWMSKMGLEQLDISLEELQNSSAEDYYSRYFNEADAKDYVPKILGLLERNNDDEIITYFQQVRYREYLDWTWHMSSTRIFYRDEQNRPLYTITISFPIDAMHHMVNKAGKLLDENNFLRQNHHRYCRLSKREREVLKYMALGKSSSETAIELFISLGTVDTHRKNIRKKLETKSYFELSQYARSFDLI
ncbi:MAG: helix-turn-helix transcriptional regulator [Sphingobacteriales bacterium 17-39-43]|uniref:response regulator transcription factor n=1 Tax=Daejeonella sp. TaxID=2805397 RepID=UPI000BC5B21B|nr:helix-turn-helix transcriptional regulator [Daejeonella sp.]OYZ33137.1 MAG: helix-turn-helix transcriptional regulator [Sphingobacteriales bacterium 16-39-50]OZA26546.1 MAG: helix-turn-helix transcriptional regulator [Sphingobacteriales bacterium 17-39-43]OZA62003.1 MAG: helix-turn-helix transcriptional regulator [Sphingobacteriales bacterium 39-40-5]HQS05664.1 helix-turn-helix transcriptional regulator [Daejeonella sp.]HQS50491.1 helix-turn-helix transcriptional regulator [Daejeonella sp.]